MIDFESDRRWIREAIRLAAAARDRGDEPFGALLVHSGVAVSEARNAINTDNDLTQHAELRLISKASRRLGPAVVAASTLYTSTEPCAMCAGAAYWAGIGRIVFGFGATSLEQMTGGDGLHQPSRRVLGEASRQVAIDGPILETEARVVHDGYW
jgi:tRNA(Arg) A34 adenosine deaminase TadA